MFIVIDGLDGSGKGTQTKLVVENLQKLGKKVLILDYPRYGEESCYFVEKYLNGKYGKNLSAKASSVFFALDRFDDSYNHNFSEYDYVISNRYVSANMIHQAGKIKDSIQRKEYISWLQELEYEIFGISKPDKVLFLDVPVEVSKKLVEAKEERAYIESGNKDIHEADTRHLENAYNVAKELIDMFDDWMSIDCSKDRSILPREAITQKILSHII